MIRTLLSLLPLTSRTEAFTQLTLTVLSVITRAVGAVFLIPIVSALFGPRPAEAWPWVAGLAVVTVAGWAFDAASARIGYELGFGLLETGQRGVSERLSRTRLTWFDAQNTATARQGIAATGPDLVGVVIYLVTPVLSALLLPIAIGLALLPRWRWRRWPGCPCCGAPISRRAGSGGPPITPPPRRTARSRSASWSSRAPSMP